MPDFPDLPSLKWVEDYLKELGVDQGTKDRILQKYEELKSSTKDGEWIQNISDNVVVKIDLINQWIEEAKQEVGKGSESF